MALNLFQKKLSALFSIFWSMNSGLTHFSLYSSSLAGRRQCSPVTLQQSQRCSPLWTQKLRALLQRWRNGEWANLNHGLDKKLIMTKGAYPQAKRDWQSAPPRCNSRHLASTFFVNKNNPSSCTQEDNNRRSFFCKWCIPESWPKIKHPSLKWGCRAAQPATRTPSGYCASAKMYWVQSNAKSSSNDRLCW